MHSVAQPLIKDQVSAGEWRCRVELAAAYRLMDHFGVRDLTYNHLSARVLGEPNAILIKPSDSCLGRSRHRACSSTASTEGPCAAQTARLEAAPSLSMQDWRGCGRS